MLLLDAHRRPPESMRSLYKNYQKLDTTLLEDDFNVIDLTRGLTKEQSLHSRIVHSISSTQLKAIYSRFCGVENVIFPSDAAAVAYQFDEMPGLLMLPSLLPKKVQWHLLSRLLHRDLANEEHKTNVHLHYHIPYQRADAKLTDNDLKNCTGEQDQSWEGTRSFFNIVPDAADVFKPVDALTHKPFTASHFLHKKLRWMTLGGQYDWTKKEYPGGDPPAFPVDLANLIHGLFPEMSPQAAIVNIYTPGDTLSLHRDVSEDSDHGLVSISLGCDGIFIIGTEALAGNGSKTLVIRLRSGDAIYMSGASRYAWHGIPLVVPKTCPSELREWPAHPNGIDTADGRNSAEFNHWRDWMSSKRININVRQMANS